jgi:purine-nucleoside/S-methyl-5'-thioadenosine phosphorylase / adenosine deaminase
MRALVSPVLEARGFLAVFTERTGGSSSGPFASLNLGRETGDDPFVVEENWSQLRSALELDLPVTARQVHGDRVVPIERAGVDSREIGEADALTTTARSVPLAVMVADCVPLALASEEEGRCATVHVGWRGLASGIVRRALDSFAHEKGVAAAIGPSIGPCHYEVGREVVEAIDAGTGGLALTRGEPLALDLPGTLAALLEREGVRVIDRASECTACEPERFFSNRRDGRSGRQALVTVRL